MVLPNVRNIQSNPNIGCDGRNINIVGTTGQNNFDFNSSQNVKK